MAEILSEYYIDTSNRNRYNIIILSKKNIFVGGNTLSIIFKFFCSLFFVFTIDKIENLLTERTICFLFPVC
jgi:hypothetical protein